MRRLLVALLVTTSAAVSACGGSSPTSEQFDVSTSNEPEAQAVVQAGQNTSEEQSGRVSFKASFTGGSTSGTMTGEGAFSQRKFHLTMDVGGLSGLGGGQLEIVFANPLFYMKLPAGSGAPLPAGKEWLKLDIGKLGKTQGLELSQLMQLNQTDPSQALAFLQGAGSDFREVGTEEVRGDPTTHYRGTVDLQDVANDAPAELQTQYERLLELSEQKTVPMEVWIGDDGLVRKLAFTQALSGGSSMRMEEELYDFGTVEQVTTPPEEEVLDITGLVGNS